ncbi:MAG: glycosyltransferase family 2 protein [Patescibacteria group bacterium]
MKLSVVIPTFNGKEQLQESLPILISSLASILDESEFQVIVTDNASTDGTVEFLNSTYPHITVLSLDTNTGFTGASNAGVRQAEGTYLLLLNNDCMVSADTLSYLIQYLDSNPSLSAVQPAVVSPEGTVENIGFILDIRIAKAVAVTDPAQLPSGEKKSPTMTWQPETTHFYGLSATCLLIRRTDLCAVGLLNESFHSYLEDVELMIRLAKAGKRYRGLPDVQVIHHHMATSSRMGSYKQQQDFKNWIRIILLHYRPMMLVRYAVPLAIERLRNLSGIIKKTVTIS